DELLARIRTSLRLKHTIDMTLAQLHTEALQPLPTLEAVFRQEGDYWTLAYHGTVCRLKDVKGLHYLAFLLARPGEACHALAVVTTESHPPTAPGTTSSPPPSADQLAAHHLEVRGLGDAGVVLDAQAKAAYKRRLDALQDDLAEAQRF